MQSQRERREGKWWVLLFQFSRSLLVSLTQFQNSKYEAIMDGLTDMPININHYTKIIGSQLNWVRERGGTDFVVNSDVYHMSVWLR